MPDQDSTDRSNTYQGDWNYFVATIWASIGKPVFPAVDRPGSPDDKNPMTLHGFNDATTDPAQIAAWWREFPGALVGLSCGPAGLFVSDLDRKPGKPDGVENYARLAREHGQDPASLNDYSIMTAGGGVHVYSVQPQMIQLGCGRGQFSNMGIDFRGVGGYVIAAGSRRRTGESWGTPEQLYALARRIRDGQLPEPAMWAMEMGAGTKRNYEGEAYTGEVHPDAVVKARAYIAEETAALALMGSQSGRGDRSYNLGINIGYAIRSGYIDFDEVQDGLRAAMPDNPNAWNHSFTRGVNESQGKSHILRTAGFEEGFAEMRAAGWMPNFHPQVAMPDFKPTAAGEMPNFIPAADPFNSEERQEFEAVRDGAYPESCGERLITLCSSWHAARMEAGKMARKFALFLAHLPIDPVEHEKWIKQLDTLIRLGVKEIRSLVEEELEKLKPPPANRIRVKGILFDDVQQFLSSVYELNYVSTLQTYAGTPYRFDGKSYVAMSDGELKTQLGNYFGYADYVAMVGGKPKLMAYSTSKRAIGDLLENVEIQTFVNPMMNKAPFWLPCAGPGMPTATDMIVFRNGLLHWPSYRQMEHTPTFFAVGSLPFDYDPQAKCPTFDRFLSEAFETQESRDTLLEYMGLAMTDIMRFQKFLWLIGAPGTGKGTLTRLFKHLVGEGNSFVTSLKALGGNFGKQGMIDKKMLILPDVRLSAKHNDVASCLEVLLNHVGEDSVSIPRKNRPDYFGKCTAKVLICSNEAAYLHDDTGGLLRRLIVLETKGTFKDEKQADSAEEDAEQADTRLGEKLAAELPGIAIRALQALQKLLAREEQTGNNFLQPAEGLDARREIEHVLDPMARWIDLDCVVEKGVEGGRGELYQSYAAFCEKEGIFRPLAVDRFAKSLAHHLRARKVTPKTDWGRMTSGIREKVVFGIRLRTEDERVGGYKSPTAKALLGEAEALRERANSKTLCAQFEEMQFIQKNGPTKH